MRKVRLMALVMLVGCGGGSGSGGPVDPASEDACLRWANGVCRLAYLCVGAAARDAAFLSLYGPDSDNCFQGLAGRCTSNQPAGTAFGPSCGPGKTVNPTAMQTCDNNLMSFSCVDWAGAPAGGCEGICAQTVKDAGGGSGMSLAEFCTAFGSLGCERHFECDPTGSTSDYGTLTSCKAQLTSQCASISSPALCPGGFNGSLSATCLADYKSTGCAIVSLGASQIPSCGNACKY